MTADLVTFLKKCLVENLFFCAIKSLRFRAFLHVIYNHLNQLAFIKLTGKKQDQISLYYPEIFVIVLQIFFFFIFFIFYLMWLAYSPANFAAHQIKDKFKCKPTH